MLDLWEIFDAPTHVLQEELRAVKVSIPSANVQERARYADPNPWSLLYGSEALWSACCRLQNLRDTIQQELDERGGSQNVLQQLLPIIQVQTAGFACHACRMHASAPVPCAP
jgi:hypothetical protein